MPETIAQVVSEFSTSREVLNEDDLRRLWNEITRNLGPLPDEVYECFQQCVSSSVAEQDLQFGLGAWHFDLKAKAAQTILTAAAAAALLLSMGYDHIPGLVAASALACLFNVNSAHVSKRDDVLILHLRDATDDDGEPRTAEELYHALPEQERRMLAYSDFVQFLEDIRAAGAVDRSDSEKFKIREKGDSPFLRITLR